MKRIVVLSAVVLAMLVATTVSAEPVRGETIAAAHASLVRAWESSGAWTYAYTASPDNLVAFDGNLDDTIAATLDAYRSAFPDVRVEITEQAVEGELFVTRWIVTGTHRNASGGMAGGTLRVHGCLRSRLSDGMIMDCEFADASESP